MTTPPLFDAIELAQVVVATGGLVGATGEWRAILSLRQVAISPRQRRLAQHAAFIEFLRFTVHIAILMTAGMSLGLPMPPADMPSWISDVLLWRKLCVLWIACIACAGTWSARRTRHWLQQHDHDR